MFRSVVEMGLQNVIFRSWYYFRLGYGTYLTFPIGYVSTVVTIYYLAIRNIPGLLYFFPSFWIFVVIGTVTVIPLSVGIAWLHAKGTRALIAEAEIGQEASPWNYRIPPGIYMEVYIPLYKELLTGVQELLDKQGALDAQRRKRFQELVEKFDLLLAGGAVGTPRRRGV